VFGGTGRISHPKHASRYWRRLPKLGYCLTTPSQLLPLPHRNAHDVSPQVDTPVRPGDFAGGQPRCPERGYGPTFSRVPTAAAAQVLSLRQIGHGHRVRGRGPPSIASAHDSPQRGVDGGCVARCSRRCHTGDRPPTSIPGVARGHDARRSLAVRTSRGTWPPTIAYVGNRADARGEGSRPEHGRDGPWALYRGGLGRQAGIATTKRSCHSADPRRARGGATRREPSCRFGPAHRVVRVQRPSQGILHGLAMARGIVPLRRCRWWASTAIGPPSSTSRP